jgi:hypothetical protein
LMRENVKFGGYANIVMDVALNHEFGGNHVADMIGNGALFDADPAQGPREHQGVAIPRYRRLRHTVRCFL